MTTRAHPAAAFAIGSFREEATLALEGLRGGAGTLTAGTAEPRDAYLKAVDRDDLADCGASHFARTIRETRVRIPSPEDVKGHYVVREALDPSSSLSRRSYGGHQRGAANQRRQQ